MEHQLSLSSDNYMELVLCLYFELIREMGMEISSQTKPCDMSAVLGMLRNSRFPQTFCPLKPSHAVNYERVNDGKAAYKLQ